MSIAKEGYPYIFVLIIPGVLGLAFGLWWVGVVLLALGAFVAFFFRDPERIFQGRENQVVAPADGKVVSVRKEEEGEALSIFLSIFDVHVNRAPVAGTIRKIDYRKGKFLVALDERASAENEQNSISIDHEGRPVRFVQIAGVIARRIVCWKREGEKLAVGERVGLIQFGSRVDVILPPNSRIQVEKGQRVKAGLTVIGELE